jgi:translation initiation factor 1 (eIF-1/SUI1)
MIEAKTPVRVGSAGRQGDQRERIVAVLEELGHKVHHVGG